MNIQTKNNFLVINVSNSYLQTDKNKKILEWRKKTGTGRGLGLQNVELTLQKYDGILNTEQHENSFHATAIIPQTA